MENPPIPSDFLLISLSTTLSIASRENQWIDSFLWNSQLDMPVTTSDFSIYIYIYIHNGWSYSHDVRYPMTKSIRYLPVGFHGCQPRPVTTVHDVSCGLCHGCLGPIQVKQPMQPQKDRQVDHHQISRDLLDFYLSIFFSWVYTWFFHTPDGRWNPISRGKEPSWIWVGTLARHEAFCLESMAPHGLSWWIFPANSLGLFQQDPASTSRIW